MTGIHDGQRADPSRPSVPPPVTARAWLAMIVGPGLVMAATGVGAGDLITAAVNGARFGLPLLWIIVAGAIVKYVLSEGLARWQQVTGETPLEACCCRLHPAFGWGFLGYLVIWSFFVSGSLASACGLAAHALLPLSSDAAVSVALWGGLHLVGGGVLVLCTGYAVFERVMSALVGLMFVCTVVGAVLAAPDWLAVLAGALVPSAIPADSAPFILGAVGGVGGSVTLLSYGYWLREAGRSNRAWRAATRVDLALCYLATTVFGLGVMIMAAVVLHPAPDITASRDLLVQLAEALGSQVGSAGYWLLALGFWGGMVSTVIGVLNGIPFLFADTVAALRRWPAETRRRAVRTDSRLFRGYVLFLVGPPLVWLVMQKPVAMIVFFSIFASCITPAIAALLLHLNNKVAWVGRARYGAVANIVLGAVLILFLYLMGRTVIGLF